MHQNHTAAIIAVIACFALSTLNAVDHAEEAAIKEKAKNYASAFNQADAKGVSEIWSQNAVYIHPQTGETITGREAIEKHFKTTFQEHKTPKIDIQIHSITFPSPHNAIETGIATVTYDQDTTETSLYKATYRKENGQWLIAELREIDTIQPPTQYEHLKELEWLVGEWIDQDKDVVITTQFGWDKYKNFLTQQYTVETEGIVEQEGRQIITWDPIQHRIRSWIFDSDGGFGEGNWKKKGDSWVVENAQTLADGRRASAINILSRKGQDSYTWESIGREIGGEILPDIEPVTIQRKRG